MYLTNTKRIWWPILLLLVAPVGLQAQEGDDIFDLNVITTDLEFPYNFPGVSNTGFTLFNPDQLTLRIQSTFAEETGLLPGESLQQGFVLFDGTLFIQVSDLNAGVRADVRTSYRMRLNERVLARDSLAGRYIRQMDLQPAEARARARAARVGDARMMRFVDNVNGGRWKRAGVRTMDGESRFVGRMEADDVLGHYGYYTDENQNSYVWTVLDRNSRYAVGLNVDRDDDGIFNADDNCSDAPNPDQINTDDDDEGNACDVDDDNDGVSDANDNCPLVANADQADFDDDGIGNACDEDDTDSDGINDGSDLCPLTTLGSLIDANGCAIADLCPCDNPWRNHGAYVRCVTHAAKNFQSDGLIMDDEKGAIVSAAAQSSCGF